jgi:hypothetical protein
MFGVQASKGKDGFAEHPKSLFPLNRSPLSVVAKSLDQSGSPDFIFISFGSSVDIVSGFCNSLLIEARSGLFRYPSHPF